MNPVTLEVLNDQNREVLLHLNRDDISLKFVEDVAETLEQAEYGDAHKLRGHCYAVKCGGTYAGVILIGEGLAWECDPPEIKGTFFYRIMGFVLDKRYRGLGIGSAAMEQAIRNVYEEYGRAPIVIECHEENRRAIRFYEKHGFVNTNVRENEDFYLIRECGG